MFTFAINYHSDCFGLTLGVICYVIGRVAEDNKVISDYSLKVYIDCNILVRFF